MKRRSDIEEIGDSERMQARRKQHRHRFTSVLAVLLILAILGLLGYMGACGLVEDARQFTTDTKAEHQISAQIVDETGHGQISTRVKQYIAQLEEDFADQGYKIVRVTLPVNTSREVFVDLDNQPMYFKVSLDRDTAVTVEDATRMIKYLTERDLHPTYVDVRVAGKAYFM